MLYRKFRDQGLQGRSPRQVAVAYARLVLAALRVPGPGGPARFATQLGLLAGRLEGSLRYRTAYL